MKTLQIYKISPGYRKVTVWSGSKMTHSRVAIMTRTPGPGLTRKQRHMEIARWLYDSFNIPGPGYNATKGGL